FDVLEAVEREAWFPCLKTISAANVCVGRASAAEIRRINSAVRVKAFGKTKCNFLSGSTAHFQASNAGKVLPHIVDVSAGLRLFEVNRSDFGKCTNGRTRMRFDFRRHFSAGDDVVPMEARLRPVDSRTRIKTFPHEKISFVDWTGRSFPRGVGSNC